MAAKTLITIDLEDVNFILGKCFRYFHASLRKTYCTCRYNHLAKIINYGIFLNKDEKDIIVDGVCDYCASPLHLRIETHRKMGMQERAEVTWIVKTELLNENNSSEVNFNN